MAIAAPGGPDASKVAAAGKAVSGKAADAG